MGSSRRNTRAPYIPRQGSRFFRKNAKLRLRSCSRQQAKNYLQKETKSIAIRNETQRTFPTEEAMGSRMEPRRPGIQPQPLARRRKIHLPKKRKKVNDYPPQKRKNVISIHRKGRMALWLRNCREIKCTTYLYFSPIAPVKNQLHSPLCA